MPTGPTTATYGAATSVNTYPTYDTDGTPDGLMWNADGTLRQDANYDYYYDQRGNLMDVLTRAAPADRENYYVDALGARWIASHAIPNQPDVIVRYASSGIRPEIVHERVYTRPEGGSTTYTGGRYYVLGPNPDERLIFVDQDGSIAYPHTDRLGSTIALSKGGLADQKFTYGPFGEGGSGAGYEYRYTGQRRNPWNQLYHYKAREYSPEWGRFIQNDPLRFVDGPNMYAYVGNDPVNRVDPTGRSFRNNCGGSIPGTCLQAAQQTETTMLYPRDGSRNMNDYNSVFLTGVNTSEASAQSISDSSGVPVFYNRTHGLPSDAAEAARQRLEFAGDPIAAAFSKALEGVDHPLTVIAYSQGTLTARNAMMQGGLPDGSTIIFKSPALSKREAALGVWAGLVAHGKDYEIGGWSMPPGDAANLWAPGATALERKLGLIDLACGFCIHSGNGRP